MWPCAWPRARMPRRRAGRAGPPPPARPCSRARAPRCARSPARRRRAARPRAASPPPPGRNRGLKTGLRPCREPHGRHAGWDEVRAVSHAAMPPSPSRRPGAARARAWLWRAAARPPRWSRRRGAARARAWPWRAAAPLRSACRRPGAARVRAPWRAAALRRSASRPPGAAHWRGAPLPRTSTGTGPASCSALPLLI